jgi:hypothetical protein
MLGGRQTVWASCVIAVGCFAFAQRAAAEMPRARGYEHHLYVAAMPTNEAQLRALWSGPAIVIEPHDPALVVHKLALTRADLHTLRARGIKAAVLHPSFQKVLDAAYESWVHPQPQGYSGPVPEWFARVQSLQAIFDYMDELAQLSQGRASVKVIGRAFDNDLRAVRISSAAEDGERASILVTGTQHADEWLSPMVVTGLIWGLIESYESDAAVRKIVDNLNIYVVPVMNPDSYALGDLARRTNRNPQCRGGVNLNRNWPSVGWGRGVQPCGGDNFAGEEALSEPETQAVKALADSLSKLVWYVDYHTPREAVMIPYAWTSMKPDMYDEAKQAAQRYANILGVPAQDGTIIGQGQGGGSLDYFQEALDPSGGISLCIEMTGSVDMRAPSTGIPDQVDKNLRAWLAVATQLASEHPDESSAATGAAGASGAAGAGGVVAAGGGGSGAAASGSGGAAGSVGTNGAAGGVGASVAAGGVGAATASSTAGTAGTSASTPSGTATGIGALARPDAGSTVATSPSTNATPSPDSAASTAPITTAAPSEQPASSSGCGITNATEQTSGHYTLLLMLLAATRTRRRKIPPINRPTQ